MACQFEELTPFMFGKDAAFDGTSQELRALKQLYPIRTNRNYPFRSPTTTLWTKEHIISVLPSRDVADRYIRNYFDTFERTHRMLDVPTVLQQIDLFWRQLTSLTTELDFEWLAQF